MISDEYVPLVRQHDPLYKNKWLYVIIGVAVVIVLAVVLPLSLVYGTNGALPRAVHIDQIMQHLGALQDIANRDGNRAGIGTGYNESVDYVTKTLIGAGGWDVRFQSFPYLHWRVASAPVLEVNAQMLSTASEIIATRYSPSASNVRGPLSFVGDGCKDSDYTQQPRFAAGDVALIARDDETLCSVQAKVDRAHRFQAAFVVLFSGPQMSGPASRGLSAPPELPVVSVSESLGHSLLKQLGEQATLNLQTEAQTVFSKNVIADYKKSGSEENIIVVGAHLDSVVEGPGINDNGSGSATTLEIARQISRLDMTPVNKLRFIWFGAEESGLIGSTKYIESFDDDRELLNIAMMLNFDMLGSPNGLIAIYNGTSDARTTTSSGSIQQLFQEMAARYGYPHEPTAFDSRSDYAPFLAKGIPCGGLFSGAEVIKSQRQREVYGGYQHVAFDPCYHEPCDSIENINAELLAKMALLASEVVERFSFAPYLRDTLNKQ